MGNGTPMQIQSWRIPYDIDRVWDDGCGGTDILGDGADEILLLVSETGSAYVCPESLRADWRLFVDSCGQEITFEIPVKGKMPVSRHFGDFPPFADVLSCGFATGVLRGPKEALFARGKCEPPPARPPKLSNDVVVTLRRHGEPVTRGAFLEDEPWKLTFYGPYVRLVRPDETVVTNGNGLIFGWSRWTETEYGLDGSDNFRAFEVEREMDWLMSALELNDYVVYLEGNRDSCAGIACLAIDYAIDVFRRSMAASKELRQFEDECRRMLEND